jgi:hypothetical protein
MQLAAQWPRRINENGYSGYFSLCGVMAGMAVIWLGSAAAVHLLQPSAARLAWHQWPRLMQNLWRGGNLSFSASSMWLAAALQ